MPALTQSPPSRARRAPGWEALSAVGLLTVLPLPRRVHRAPTGVTVACFGIIGLALGGALAGLDAALAPVATAPVRSAVLLGTLAALCGAMHLDGLMDSADGLFGGRDAERRLAIMRDSRVGSFGVAAAATVLLVQWSALGTIEVGRLEALVVAVGVSRAAAGVALAWPPARRDGLGSAYSVPGRTVAALVGMLAVAAAAAGLAGVRGLLAAAAGALVATAVGVLFARRAGGMTGDGCGAAGELALAVALVVLGARP